MRASRSQLPNRLARLNALSFGLVFGLLSGLGLWLASALALLSGSPGPRHALVLLRQYFPGYSPTPLGVWIGFFWAFALGFTLAVPTAWLYYRGVLRQITRVMRSASEAALTTYVAEIHVPFFALAFGLMSGLGLFLATIWLVIRHQPDAPLGPNLRLLSQYLPGYRVSLIGGLIGFAYLLLLGGIFFAAVGWIYNRLISSGSARAADSDGNPPH
jgi:hypothetical protein